MRVVAEPGVELGLRDACGEICLVADDQYDHILLFYAVVQLAHPVLQLLEGDHIGQVEDQGDYIRVAVVASLRMSYSEAIERYFSSPAVSQMCRATPTPPFACRSFLK